MAGPQRRRHPGVAVLQFPRALEVRRSSVSRPDRLPDVRDPPARDRVDEGPLVTQRRRGRWVWVSVKARLHATPEAPYPVRSRRTERYAVVRRHAGWQRPVGVLGVRQTQDLRHGERTGRRVGYRNHHGKYHATERVRNRPVSVVRSVGVMSREYEQHGSRRSDQRHDEDLEPAVAGEHRRTVSRWTRRGGNRDATVIRTLG